MAQDFGDEFPRPCLARRVEDLRRRPHLDHLALAMNTTLDETSRTKPISWLTISIVMPSAASRGSVEDLADQLGIERRGHLVEQQDLGPQRQRPRDGDALLLAARELVGIGFVLVVQPHLGQQASRVGLDLGRGRPLILTGAIVTLPSTLMFWNRLYCWNTMAIAVARRRRRRRLP